jgi:hypothetical protein
MNESIDGRIADLERELSSLRRQKLAELQSQMAVLQASIGGSEVPAFRAATRGRPRKEAWTPGGQDVATSTQPKRRGRKREKQIPDADAVAALARAVQTGGNEGVSARQASQLSGIAYPRAIKLMDQNFRKSGRGKGTRYTA